MHHAWARRARRPCCEPPLFRDGCRGRLPRDDAGLGRWLRRARARMRGASAGGRASVWLGAAGRAGLSDILDITSREISAVMGLLGHRNPASISENCLVSSHDELPIHAMPEKAAE